MEILARNIKETEKLAADFISKILKEPAKDTATVITLQGDLGAGKTAFTKGIAETLGIQKEYVTSPTFVIQKIYKIDVPPFKKLIHIDAYRFENEKEANVLNLEKLFNDSQNLIIIEWPEKILSLIPKNAHEIILTFIDDSTRKIKTHA